jgi:hypothetical protein
VFAGVTIFRKIIDKLGVDYPQFDCYPKVLNPYYCRNIRVSTVGEERLKFDKNPIPVFVKPIKPKQFIGNVWSSILNLIPLANIPDETPCYVCEPMNILSEFRVYVHDGDILGVKHYYGDWSIIPNKKTVENIVKNYHPCPIAYGIDIGVTSLQGEYIPFVIEVNDGCNLGNYGLDYIHYGEMMVSRWFEIMGSHAAAEGIKSDIEKFKDNPYSQEPGGTMERLRSMDYRKMMTKVLSKEARTKSMKSFGEDVQRRVRESEDTTELNIDIGIPEVNLELKNPPIVAGHRQLKSI